uniref:Uncharacterized protein n=1 Tax=Arundo donax TaxID=35708 RepID=A0A0A9FV77_ARUDO
MLFIFSKSAKLYDIESRNHSVHHSFRLHDIEASSGSSPNDPYGTRTIGRFHCS